MLEKELKDKIAQIQASLETIAQAYEEIEVLKSNHLNEIDEYKAKTQNLIEKIESFTKQSIDKESDYLLQI